MKSMRKTLARVSLLVVVLMMVFSFAAFAEVADDTTVGNATETVAVDEKATVVEGEATEESTETPEEQTVSEDEEGVVTDGAVSETTETEESSEMEEAADDNTSTAAPDSESATDAIKVETSAAIDNFAAAEITEDDLAAENLSDDTLNAAVSNGTLLSDEQAARAEAKEDKSIFYNKVWALLPPIIAIALALITKEVYSSLALGILSGGILYAVTDGGFDINRVADGVLNKGLIASLADGYNAGILIFLVVLGIIVVLMNRAGGSRAYGEWAARKINSTKGASLATFALGVLIFVDDYFNCLTVGSVMRPVTDKQRVSRAKLAYLIDATAAPVCIIAPISSWAAAVSGTVDDVNGIELFIKTIPYNLYALLTLTMVVFICVTGMDFGPMKRFEVNAKNGDLFTTGPSEYSDVSEKEANPKGRVIDLVLPVVVLIVCCVLGMLYTGYLGGVKTIIDAFAGCDASIGLSLGSLVALVIIVIYMICRRVLSFNTCMSAIPEGFKAMVPAILILVFAWSLKNATSLLGADIFVASVVDTYKGIRVLLPTILFVVAVGLSFATGTSWGTFGILIPIVTGVFQPSAGNMSSLFIICISACLAGAVCGDHCSPISDTTIMSSTGAQCKHVDHVSTQLPYAILVAAVCLVGYLVAGFVQNVFVILGSSLILLIAVLSVIMLIQKKIAK